MSGDIRTMAWLSLADALRLVVLETNANGERYLSFMTSRLWAFYEHETSIEAIHGPGSVPDFRAAVKAEHASYGLLESWLADNKVKGTGTRSRTGERIDISEAEWGTYDVRLWSNELDPPSGTTGAIRNVMVKAADVRALLREPPVTAETQASPEIVKNRGGRKPRTDWALLHTWIARTMDDRKEFDPSDNEWNAQARLEEAALEYARTDLRLGEDLSASTIRPHVRKGLALWREAQADENQ